MSSPRRRPRPPIRKPLQRESPHTISPRACCPGLSFLVDNHAVIGLTACYHFFMSNGEGLVPRKPDDSDEPELPLEPARGAAESLSESENTQAKIMSAFAKIMTDVTAGGDIESLRSAAIRNEGFDDAAAAVLDDYLRMARPSADAADNSEADPLETVREIQQKRRAARRELDERFGNVSERVPGTKGWFWMDAATGSAWVISANGEHTEIKSGETWNFGDRKGPAWKKWNEWYWGQPSPADIQRVKSGRADRQRVDSPAGDGATTNSTDNADAKVPKQKKPKAPKGGRVNTEAKGINAKEDNGDVVEKVGDTYVVRNGNQVRLATQEEIDTHLDDERERAKKGAPTKRAEREAEEAKAKKAADDAAAKAAVEAAGAAGRPLTQDELERVRRGVDGMTERTAAEPRMMSAQELARLRAMFPAPGLDPRKFRMVMGNQFTGGRPGEPYYVHEDAPGVHFSGDDVQNIWNAGGGFNQIPLGAGGAGAPPGGEAVAHIPVPISGIPWIPGLVQVRGGRGPLGVTAMLHPNAPQGINLGPSMEEILGDKRRSTLFMDMLSSQGRAELRDRLMQARSNPDAMSSMDWQELTNLRVEFGERFALAEEARQLVSQEDVQMMLRNDPAFSVLAGSVRPERATELIREHLFKVFMRRDQATLTRFIGAQQALAHIRSIDAYKDMQRRVGEVTKMYGITPERLASGQVDKSLMKRMFNPGFFGAFSRQEMSQRSRHLIDAVSNNLRDISMVLGHSVSDDKEFLRDVVNEAYGVRAPAIGGREPSRDESLAEERTLHEHFDTASLENKFKSAEWRKRFRTADGRDWDHTPDPDERMERSFELLQNERNAPRQRQESGWFTGWLSSLFDRLFDNARTELRGAFA